ncbi:MAG TPA: VWA domain-containing protein, partial [Thermoanaerobaculia bacterium]
ISATASAATQLTLERGKAPAAGEYKGIVDLFVDPGFSDCRVWITFDGQKIAEGLAFPHRVTVDLGPTAMEHKVSITAIGGNKRKVQWHATINRGHLPLTVRVEPVDMATRTFEAKTTCPKDDAIASIDLWHEGKQVLSVSEPPYRFAVPHEVYASGFVQVTARAKSGAEAADFWSPVAGSVHVETMQVRTVPIFVSVVDRNGSTQAEVDKSLFRIMDNDAEGTIVEFGSAFDQPISIAVLVDGSASMTYSMRAAAAAAAEFVNATLKDGDRCSVTAIQEVPRRRQPLTADKESLVKALQTIEPSGTTALYDAIATAIRELKDEKSRRAVVALTDGGDTDSIRSYEEIEKIAAEAGIPIYFIAYNTGQETHPRDIERLKHLSALTGGFVAVATNHNLNAKYGEIERDLRAQFAILYRVADFVRPKEWRRVKVTLASPKLTARTIRGYFTQ